MRGPTVVALDVIVDDDFPARVDRRVGLLVGIVLYQVIEVGQMFADIGFEVARERLQAGAIGVEIDEDAAAENLEAYRPQAEIGRVEIGAAVAKRRARERSAIVVRPGVVRADNQVADVAAIVQQDSPRVLSSCDMPPTSAGC